MRRNSLAAFGLSLLLIAPLLAISGAAAEVQDLELVLEFEGAEDGAWFTDASDLHITVSITNTGDVQRHVEYNPACPFDLWITGESLDWDLDDERVCPEQRRGMDINPGQTRTLASTDWDWTGASGGPLHIEAMVDGISTTQQIDFHPQLNAPSALELHAALGQIPEGMAEHDVGMDAQVHLTLVNTANTALTLPFDDGCRIQFQAAKTALPCSTGTLAAGGARDLGWHTWDFAGATDGIHTLAYGMTGVLGLSTSVDAAFTATPSAQPAEVAAPNSPLFATAVGEHAGDGSPLDWTFTLTNTAERAVQVDFASNCLVEMHVLNEDGLLVKDTRDARDCHEPGPAIKLQPSTAFTAEHGAWDFTDEVGCEVADGTYRIVLAQPELRLSDAFTITYDGADSGERCRAEAQDTTHLWFTVEDFEILARGTASEAMQYSLQLENGADEPATIWWPSTCQVEMALMHAQAVVETAFAGCEITGGIHHLGAGESLVWGPFTIPMFIDEVPRENGTWQVVASTQGLPRLSAGLAHTWTQPDLSIPDSTAAAEPEEEVEVQPEPALPETFELSGNWHWVTLAHGGCWLITDETGTEHALAGTTLDWAPQPHLTGVYTAALAPAPSECERWSGLDIQGVTAEQVVAPTSVETPDPRRIAPTPMEVVVEQAPATVAVIATTSLTLSLLVFVGNTEWVRIPALQAGIGLIGMVRRSREHDGEYQRGRIMGYLTANPGVHFRALLGALGMSNGQLTHHLKALETEERIWRRKDGRLVRFYPASIQETTDEEDLPVPLLTPDPNSLQGKILRLLDPTENDIVNLSQKEHSVRLEASQQLVSHHLRTLQKFGLVEREKVGMRYRYELTREAIFLLNLNEFNAEQHE